MVLCSRSPTQQRLNSFINQTRSIIKTINTQHNSYQKLPFILEYFNIITNKRNFKFIALCVDQNRSLSSHFASINVSFANKLHYEFIISGFFNTHKNTPINQIEFSDFLTQIIDLYGFQIKTKFYDQ